MFFRVAFPTFVLSIALVVLADPTPSSPGPGDVFKPGSACTIGWTPDSTGTWKTMNIELMTGDNLNMVHLTTVGTVDGTTSPGTYSYTCPAVTVPAPIYFYQFTSPSSSDKLWTGRFAITDASGATVAAPNATQNGQAIPWGTGALADPSAAVPAPVIGTNSTSSNTTSTASVSGSAASSVMTTPASSSGSDAGSTPAFASSSGAASDTSSGPAVAASSTSTGSNSGALALGTVSSRAAKAGVALAVIAGTFMFIA